jgi:hypothetical protein
MPSGRSFYHRRPGRYAIQKQEFRRLITELKRLASKEGYSREQIASDLEVSVMTVGHWVDGVFLNGLAPNYRATERVSNHPLRSIPLAPNIGAPITNLLAASRRPPQSLNPPVLFDFKGNTQNHRSNRDV